MASTRSRSDSRPTNTLDADALRRIQTDVAGAPAEEMTDKAPPIVADTPAWWNGNNLREGEEGEHLTPQDSLAEAAALPTKLGEGKVGRQSKDADRKSVESEENKEPAGSVGVTLPPMGMDPPVFTDPLPPATRTRNRPRMSCCLSSTHAKLLFVALIHGGVLLACIYLNYVFGYEVKWAMSFLVQFVLVPIILLCFGLSLGILISDLSGILSGTTMIFMLGMGFPIAITAQRLRISRELGDLKSTAVASGNCWKAPIVAKEWQEKVEFIEWSDSSWRVDATRMKVVRLPETSDSGSVTKTHLYCVAPIIVREPLKSVCGQIPNMVATCYGVAQGDAKTATCSADTQRKCGWHLPSRIGYGRVFRYHGHYKAWEDDEELKKYTEGVKKVFGSKGGMVVEYLTERGPLFFLENVDKLKTSLTIQVSLTIAVWWAIALCAIASIW